MILPTRLTDGIKFLKSLNVAKHNASHLSQKCLLWPDSAIQTIVVQCLPDGRLLNISCSSALIITKVHVL